MKMFYTTREISMKLDKDIKTIQRWIRSGKLKAIKENGQWYVSRIYFDRRFGL